VGGTGEPLLAMKYVANDDVVKTGERVVTSGMDRIFPRDLPVGTVAEVKAGNPFKQIRIRPAANLERLEEVIVLLTLRPLELKKDSAAVAPAAAPAAVTP
jgi:rod shape-determining protein MreC